MIHSIQLPKIFSAPIKFIPKGMHSAAISQVLNPLLAVQREDGELDFLHHKILQIVVEDMGIEFYLSFNNGQLITAKPNDFDVKISGNVHDFLLLISRSEDADTLFFQRRLKMQGDTELGLYLKNFLDGIDVDSVPYYQKVQPILIKSIRFFEKVFFKIA